MIQFYFILFVKSPLVYIIMFIQGHDNRWLKFCGKKTKPIRDMTMVGVERFDKSKLQTADQPKQSLAKSKDMTLVIIILVSLGVKQQLPGEAAKKFGKIGPKFSHLLGQGRGG